MFEVTYNDDKVMLITAMKRREKIWGQMSIFVNASGAVCDVFRIQKIENKGYDDNLVFFFTVIILYQIQYFCRTKILIGLFVCLTLSVFWTGKPNIAFVRVSVKNF